MTRVQFNRQSQEGVILLEALISILIFSLGVLALVGLQGAMIKNTTESRYRAEASYIAQQRIGQLWAANPADLSTYLESNTNISALLPAGRRSVTQPSPGQFLVTVNWQLPGEPVRNLVMIANISGG